MRVGKWYCLTIGVTTLLSLTFCGLALSAEAPRVSKEELKGMMGSPGLVIIDVRAGSDWTKSKEKIQGAVREDPGKKTSSWAKKYPKDKKIVLYCA